jgi:hypothetical protein
MMEPAGGEDMARRLDQLERAVRHWKLIGIACMAVAIGSMTLVLASSVRWTAGPKLVEAQGFVLKDLKGEMRAILGMQTNGDPLLTFYGKDGKANLTIGYNNNPYCTIVLLGPDKSRTTIFETGDGRGGMAVHDREGETRTSVGLWGDNMAGMSVFDRTGAKRATFGTWESESSGMNVFDRMAGNRASFGVKQDGMPMLLLRDSTGESLFEEPQSSEDQR